ASTLIVQTRLSAGGLRSGNVHRSPVMTILPILSNTDLSTALPPCVMRMGIHTPCNFSKSVSVDAKMGKAQSLRAVPAPAGAEPSSRITETSSQRVGLPP